jgi:hypothetical protein
VSEHQDPLDPTTLLQPAATRVRDPVSGRSVWLAGMVQNVRTKGMDIVYDVHFLAEHGVGDRQAITSAIEENLRGLGFRGKVYAPRPRWWCSPRPRSQHRARKTPSRA